MRKMKMTMTRRRRSFRMREESKTVNKAENNKRENKAALKKFIPML